MTINLAKSNSASDRVIGFPPYPASVVDGCLGWVKELPIPARVFYPLLLASLIIIFNGLSWIDGSLPLGTFDLYRSSVPVYPVSVLVLLNYLNSVARRALSAFLPVLGASETDHELMEFSLVTLPRRGTWVTIALSLAFTGAYVNFTPYLVELFRRSLWIAIVESLIYAFTFGMIGLFLFHTIWQLHMVSRIHSSATNVNLFQLSPLYAFSGLTAQTGISLLLMNYFGVLTDPATFENITLITLTFAASLIAIACFVLPLRGMHIRLVTEKKRLRAEASARINQTIQQLYSRWDSQELNDADKLNQMIVALVKARDVIDKIPTWPWEQGTLTSFISALLLPFVVRLIVGIVGLLLF